MYAMAASRASSGVAAAGEDEGSNSSDGLELSMMGVFVTLGAKVALELGAGDFELED